MSNLVRDWRTNGGRIVIGAPQGVASTGKSKLIYDLAICIPDVSRCTYDAAALLRRGLPFACLMETSLLCRIPEKDNWERDEQVASMLPGTTRVSFSEAAYTWVIGFCAVDKHIQYCIRKASMPSKRKRLTDTGMVTMAAVVDGAVYAARMMTVPLVDPSPHAMVPQASLRPTALCAQDWQQLKLCLPLDAMAFSNWPHANRPLLVSWLSLQQQMLPRLQPAARCYMVHTSADGWLYRPPAADFGCVLVPGPFRASLVLYADMVLGHPDDLAVPALLLRRWYWWPRLEYDCDRIVRSERGYQHIYVAGQLQLALPGYTGAAAANLGSLTEWIAEQQVAVKAMSPVEVQHLVHRDHDQLTLYKQHDDVGRILVPVGRRKVLVKLEHERLFHLGHRKVYVSLKARYYWPRMQADCKSFLQFCDVCQVNNATRTKAHAQWRVKLSTRPRTSYGFDFKGCVAADNGHCIICVAIDLCSHWLTLWSQPSRQADVTARGILHNVCNLRGVPLLWHSDTAAELLGLIMTRFWNAYGTVVTHVRSYKATGNATAERVMRYLNKVLRQLTDAQYREWPEYLSTAAAVWNSTVTDTIGMSPAEADTGLPMRSPTGSLFQRPPGAPTTASRSELAVL